MSQLAPFARASWRFAAAAAAWCAASGLAAPAAAQCQLCPADSGPRRESTESFRPLQVSVTATLDFSRLIAGDMGGAVAIDPVSGTPSVSGDVVDIGGAILSGEAVVTGEPGRVVSIDLPREITLESDDGRTARVTGIETSLPPAPRLGADGSLTFRFGGRLRVGPDDDGNYRGRIPINVEYEVR